MSDSNGWEDSTCLRRVEKRIGIQSDCVWMGCLCCRWIVFGKAKKFEEVVFEDVFWKCFWNKGCLFIFIHRGFAKVLDALVPETPERFWGKLQR